MSCQFAIEGLLAPDEFIDVLRRSALAERRPVDEPERIAGMLAHADIVLTARNEAGLLIGVSRAITDFNNVTNLSDPAVDRAYQRQGIGREFIRRTHEAAGVVDVADSIGRAGRAPLLPAHRHAAPRFMLDDRAAAVIGGDR